MRFILRYLRLAFLWFRSFFVRELPAPVPEIQPLLLSDIMDVEEIVAEAMAAPKERTFVVLHSGRDGVYTNRSGDKRTL